MPITQNVQASYLTDILPGIILMSVGMGLTFVPVTLTAVHHVRAEDSGIGSGVLNTMQQVGGALGLSTLATLATQTITDRSKELGQAMADPIVQHQVFTEGATDAFLLASGLMIAASPSTWIFLQVKHEELATDGPEVAPAVV